MKCVSVKLYAVQSAVQMFEYNTMYNYNTIAANHFDFGGILPLFTQYSAIPIGMTKFRQNLKKFGNANAMDKDYTCARPNIFQCFVSSCCCPLTHIFSCCL